MNGEERQRVYNVLWDWTVLQLTAGCATVDDRLEWVRTLYRLASADHHIMALLRVWTKERDSRVQTTLSWACYQFLSRVPCETSHRILKQALPLLEQLLQDPSQPKRLLCCEMLRKLNVIGFVPDDVLTALDPFVAGVLGDYSARCEKAVDAVLRYFLARPPAPPFASSSSSSSVTIPIDHFLPCGGLGWRTAIEYIARNCPRLPAVTAVAIAPVPSNVEMRHLVGTLSHQAQVAFVTMVATLDLSDENGPLLYTLLDALQYCQKAVHTLPEVVPQTIHILNTMGEQIGPEYHVRLWDAGWALLDTVVSEARPAARVVQHLPNMLGLLRQMPAAGPCWNRAKVRRTLAAAYEHSPHSFEGLDWSWAPTLEGIPDAVLRNRMDSIVFHLIVHSCTLWVHSQPQQPPLPVQQGAGQVGDMACLRLICRMDPAERERHHDFVQQHAEIVAQCIPASDMDAALRRSIRDMLPLIPPSFFAACAPALTERIAAGHSSGLLAIYTLPPERLVFFTTALFRRVLAAFDIYSDELRPSLALITMARLPIEVLRPVVEYLVAPDDTDPPDALRGIAMAMPVEDRLFVLRHLPVKSLLRSSHVEALASAFLRHESVVVAQLMMEIVVATQHTDVCDDYASWNMYLVKHGPTRHLRELAFKMLLCADGPVLLSELRDTNLQGVEGYFVCKLLDRLDEAVLSAFFADVLRVCGGNFYAQLPMELLARMPLTTLLQKQRRVLDVIERRNQKGMRWDASRKVLQRLANAGVTLAKDMLWEHRYTYTTAT
jgi:hypothetical protein